MCLRATGHTPSTPLTLGLPSMNRRSPLRLKRTNLFFVAVLLGASLVYCGALSAADDAASRVQIEPAIQKVYPALVRIYVVSEKPSGGRMQRQQASGSGAIVSSDEDENN